MKYKIVRYRVKVDGLEMVTVAWCDTMDQAEWARDAMSRGDGMYTYRIFKADE